MFYLLTKSGSKTVCLYEAKTFSEVWDFAKEAKVTGVITETYLTVDHENDNDPT